MVIDGAAERRLQAIHRDRCTWWRAMVPPWCIHSLVPVWSPRRKEIAGWGKQGRKLVGEVVVTDALAPEAARRAQR